MPDIFEKASKAKLRFSYGGNLSTEDLWELELEQLDAIAISLDTELKKGSLSFISTKPASDKTSQLRFDIVRRIIDVKLAEKEAAKRKAENKVRREKILDIIASKQDAALEKKSINALLSELNEMEEAEVD